MSNTYHKLIKQLRTRSDFSQVEVSTKLNISRASYVSVEKGKRELSLSEANILCKLYNTTLENLLSGKEELHKRKYEQMLFVFLRNLKNDGQVPKTKLAKLLYLADFAWFYHNLKSMSGLAYRKIEHGPVPDYYFLLLEELEGDGKISIKPKGKALLVSETRTGQRAETNLLSDKELRFIKNIGDKWRNKDTKEIVDFTHSQLPYTFADKGSIIPYELITQEDPKHVY